MEEMTLCFLMFKQTSSYPCSADSEDVPIGMPHVYFANTPRHVGRWPGNFQSLFEAMLVDNIDAVYPDRHPHAFVVRVLAIRTKGPLQSALAATAL
jgi:hypothetical protein